MLFPFQLQLITDLNGLVITANTKLKLPQPKPTIQYTVPQQQELVYCSNILYFGSN